MKYTLLAVTAAVATTFGLELAKAPTPVAEQKPETKLYSTTFHVETILCPVVGDGKSYSKTVEPTEPGEVVQEYIHCRKCEVGALFPLEKDPSVGRCSYCHEEFADAFKN